MWWSTFCLYIFPSRSFWSSRRVHLWFLSLLVHAAFNLSVTIYGCTTEFWLFDNEEIFAKDWGRKKSLKEFSTIMGIFCLDPSDSKNVGSEMCPWNFKGLRAVHHRLNWKTNNVLLIFNSASVEIQVIFSCKCKNIFHQNTNFYHGNLRNSQKKLWNFQLFPKKTMKFLCANPW